jgi:crotonobetainyl-CoA:carnitine CoA-transferase CaiB-like acyl-CoA transferase
MLEDLRIVEIGEGMAVQLAGLLLAELGADVLKIERPGGDPARGSATFANWNRGKRSLLLDLDTPDGGEALVRRLTDADVLLHQFTPTRARALGLDDATLARLNPRLVVCGITGSPVNHPDVERSDDELLVSARMGKFYENDGYRDGPIVWRYRNGGWAAGHLAAGGVLARLVMRLQSGRGGPAHTSIMQGILSQLPLVWARNSRGPMPNPPVYSYEREPLEVNQLWQCQGGDWLQIMDPARQFDYASMPTMWDVLAEGADLSTVEGTADAFARRPIEAWLADLREADIAAEPAYPLGKLLFHDDVRANGYVVDVDDPELGRTTQPNTPIHANRPLPQGRPAPARGQGGDEPWAERQARDPGRSAPAEVLEGTRVLDLGMFVAGPMGPSLMGDMGADVIKVEALTGDRVRFMHRYYQAAARSKRSLALDLTKPEARPILERLIRWAEVLHHNMRFKGADKLGLSEEAIRQVNPDIAFSYVSAYGQRGNRANWPGFDSIFTAIAGIEFENAGEGNRPVFDRPGPMDLLSALSCFVGTMAAHYAGRSKGEAWTVQSSLLGVATLVQGELLVGPDGALTETYHLDHEQTGFGPYHRIYECRERQWVAVAAHDPAEREALRRVFGSDEQGFAEAARGRDAAELLAALEAGGVPSDLVVFDDAMNRFFDDPLNRRLNLVSALEQPEYGLVEQPGSPWWFGDETPVVFKRACPTVGEHTDEIMRQIGYSDAEIAAFRESKVIG